MDSLHAYVFIIGLLCYWLNLTVVICCYYNRKDIWLFIKQDAGVVEILLKHKADININI